MAKKTIKKILKAALLGGTGYLAAKALGKRGLKGNAKKLTEGNIGIGQSAPIIDDYNYKPKTKIPSDYLDTPTWAAKGGRIGAKHGGHVKSMGVAKRGGGVAKR